MRRVHWLATAVLIFSSVAIADELILTNGSRLVGQVKEIVDDKVVFESDFSVPVKIDQAKILGITTDQPVSVQLQSGDRAVGVLRYTPDGGQQVTAEALGVLKINIGQVSSMWIDGQDSPEMVRMKAKLHAAENPWSARLQFGLDGQTGNTDRVAVNGRMDIYRETESDRLQIYAQGRSSRENGQDTVKEVLGGLNVEVDVDEKWFVFGRTELEFDKFEDLDLRTSISGGVGYFVKKTPEERLKLRAGIGFQHESFDSGNSDDQAVADLGWDYRKTFSPTLLFTHSTTIFPSFEDISDFRVVMENAVEIPLSSKENWKLRVGVRNNYDAMPERGIERLDTYYMFNIAVDWQ